MTIITLLTDFGMRDGYPGVMKGVIWKIAPEVQIADLTHDIRAHDVMGAALVLWRSAPFFPAGTVHVAVVDPGVGTRRRAMAAQIGVQYFVGPDNGIFSRVLARAEANRERIRLVNLDKPKYWLAEISQVFHGRDVFSPVAAYLASGTPFEDLGSKLDDPIRLELPQPKRTSHGWQGQVIHIDHFGNLSTTLSMEQIVKPEETIVSIKGKEIIGLVAAFGEQPAGTLVALIDSSGSLAIAIVNGNAAQTLGAQVGDQVDIGNRG